jgi:hypothetical protein
MKLRRAIGMGIVAHSKSFPRGIVIAVLFGLDFLSAVEAPARVWVN